VNSAALQVVSSWRSKSEAETPFHVVLDRLIEEAEAAGEPPSHTHAMPAYDWTSLAEADAPATIEGAAHRLYIDPDGFDGTGATTPAPPRSIEEAVALELHLSDDLEPAEIERRRRAFAYRNHPDRFGPAHQALALQRMTVANVLIDRALRVARSRPR
jgi:hypothetical protein